MSVQRMPNGQYVEIADGTPPEVVARIRAQYAPSRTAAPRAGAAPTRGSAGPPAPVSEQERRTRDYQAQTEGPRERRGAAEARRIYGPLGTAVTNWAGTAVDGLQALTHEFSFGADDAVTAAGTAATSPDVWAGRRGLGEEYSAAREGLRRARNTVTERSPIVSTAGSVLGMVRAPVRGVLGLGGRAVAAAIPRAAPLLARAAQATTGVVRQGAVHGATQAGLTTLADTDGNIGHAAMSAGGGAIGGAIGGAVVRGGTGLVRAVRDRRPEQAERVAYDKIAALLGRARTESGRVMTPTRAAREIAVAGGRGTPMTVGDMSNEMADMRGSLARETNLPYANTVADRASSRLGGVPDRFETELRRRLPVPGDNMDAVLTRGAVRQGQQIQGGIDYARGGAMDTPLAPTRLLLRTVFERPTSTMRAVLDDVRTIFADDAQSLKPKLGPMTVRVTRKGKEHDTLTTRGFDEIKREYNRRITAETTESAFDGTKSASSIAERLSGELRGLTDQVRRANKPYRELVGRQRDAFEDIEALNVGQKFISQMGTRPRELLANLTAKGVKNAEEIRIGVGDALRTMRHKTGGPSPIKLLRSWENNPDQRAVMVHLMGGQRQFNRFAQSLRRELSTMRSDAATLRGSNNPVLNHFAEHGEAPAAMGAWDVARAFGYGGPLAAVGAAARQVNRAATGMGPAARNETLRLLDSDGRGLAQGVAQARAVREARRQAAIARAQAAGRVAGGTAAGMYGTGE